jgi:hypothetical protein
MCCILPSSLIIKEFSISHVIIRPEIPHNGGKSQSKSDTAAHNSYYCIEMFAAKCLCVFWVVRFVCVFVLCVYVCG